jgi:hypothetical protein
MIACKYGYSHGFNWTDEAKAMLVEMRQNGYTSRQISEEMSRHFNCDISTGSVENKIGRLGLPSAVERNPDIKIYESESLPDGDYMISCDYHAPFYSEKWVNKLLSVADYCGVKEHIIVGDLFDCDWAKKYPSTDGEQRPGLDGEAAGTDPLIKALLGSFDNTLLVFGNHETRPARNVAAVNFRHIAGYLGLDKAKENFSFTEHDQLKIGTKWLLVHPVSYSQISGAVAVRLAEKFHRHILNAHGHFSAMRWDRSGEYQCVDLGGLFDQRKIAYASLRTTTHPSWNPGFGLILDGYFHHFHAGTDFRDWERS